MTRLTARQALSLVRIGFGVGGWVAPRLGLTLVTLDASPPQTAYLTRLFTSRDAALGLLTLLAPPGHRETLLRLGMVVDGSDALASALALRAGDLSRVSGLLLTGAAAGAVATGAVALRQHA